MYTVDSFVSVRIGGLVLKSPVIENNSKPKYATRLFFPVYFPLFNDNIIAKVWDKRMPSDNLIANLSQNNSKKDIFNISLIQSNDGHIPYVWVNLYGIP